MKHTDLILIILLIILIIIVIYGIATLRGESMKCLKSPVVYGINKFSEANNKDIECSCDYGISFNRTTIILKPMFPGG